MERGSESKKLCMFCFVKQTIFQKYTNTHITITTEQLGYMVSLYVCLIFDYT